MRVWSLKLSHHRSNTSTNGKKEDEGGREEDEKEKKNKKEQYRDNMFDSPIAAEVLHCDSTFADPLGASA